MISYFDLCLAQTSRLYDKREATSINCRMRRSVCNREVHVDGVEGGREDQGQFGYRHDCQMDEGSSWGIPQHKLQESSVPNMLTPF